MTLTEEKFMDGERFPVVYLAIVTLARISLSTSTSPQEGSQRIINGTEIDPPYKYPFLGSYYWDECLDNGECRPGTGGTNCGVSVVNKHWVVTELPTVVIIITGVGRKDLSLNSSGLVVKSSYDKFSVTGLHNQAAFSPWTQNLTISRCVVNHIYRKKAIANDIALVRVKGAIIFNDKVTPMNFPALDFDVTEDGEIMAQAMGWGLMTDGVEPTVAQEATLPLVTLDTCQRTYGYHEAHEGKNIFNDSISVRETNLCAGLGFGAPYNRSICYGDSGSPLVVYNSDKGTYRQVGITSFAEQCSIRGHYGAFTNVVKYINWMNSVMRSCPERIINKTDG